MTMNLYTFSRPAACLLFTALSIDSLAGGGWTATALQPTTVALYPGTQNNEVIGVSINTSSFSSTATSFTFNTSGTTNTANIANAKLWYTSQCPAFMSVGGGSMSLYGTGPASPNGSFTITGSASLITGYIYYFWLTYDVVSGAPTGNVLDAQCTSVTYNGTPQAPAVTSPAGSRTISGALSPNMVPNPGFETYSACPAGNGEVGRAAPWYMPTGASSDYLNACYMPNGTGVDVPDNFTGSQAAHGGSAYMGAYLWYSMSGNMEYIQSPLSRSLTAGNTYMASMWVSPSEEAVIGFCSIQDIGMYFSSGALLDLSIASTPLGGGSITPQVEATSIISDRSSWTRICGTFVASGGENYVSIGNFSTKAATTRSGCDPSFGRAYYYIDDVWVEDLTVTGGAGCTALPVEWVSFGGVEKDGNVFLSWQTASEQNNGHFTVERSTDGKNFSFAGTVKPATAQTDKRAGYEFIDALPYDLPASPAGGRLTTHDFIYYRLKQTDLDGNFSYSKVISVALPGRNAFSIGSVHVKGQMVEIACTGIPAGGLSIQVYDLTGTELLRKVIGEIPAGSFTVHLDISELQKGVYFLQVNPAGEKCNVQGGVIRRLVIP